MKKVIPFILGMLLMGNIVVAQPWMAKIKPGSPRNFYAIKKAFDDYWYGKKPQVEATHEKDESETPEDDSYLQFERWENFMEPRVFPTGNFFDPTILQKEFEKYKLYNSVRSTQGSTPTWSFIGPNVVPGDGGGAGRVDCIAISPVDTNTIFVGAASGGLWVTHDGGKTWSTTTDLLPALSIADIAINPNNTDTMYVATGDGYGYEVGEGNASVFWGGTYTAGVMKSTDGGLTWNTTGLGYKDDSLNIIQRLLLSPKNNNIMLVATRNGIYRTTDAAVTWTKVFSSRMYDMAYNTTNADTVYAVDTANIYKSSDGGTTWSVLNNTLFQNSDRITIATTPANSKYIYVINYSNVNPENLYRSTDGGKTFTTQSYPYSASFYGYYDLVMNVSPVNANVLYCGGLELVKSNDGGKNWIVADDIGNYAANNYVHADKHTIAFYPGSSSKLLCGNDGGLFRTTSGGSAWTDISDGLDIKQYYRLSSSASDANLISAGAQDNGTDLFQGANWLQVFGADGMQPLIDYTDDNILYASYQYGEILKSTDGGNTFNDITPSGTGGGNWTTPYILNPKHNNTIIAGYDNVVRSYDGGNTWSIISGINMVGGTIINVTIAPSDTNYIYAASNGTIIRSTDNGVNWIDITGTLPVNLSAITWVAVSSYNPNKIWVTFSGYEDSLKVFVSKDAGNNWINYSGTLPNIPADCIAYQPNTKDILYLGTDFGVYVRDSTMNDWVTYNNGLPNVIIDELEVVPNSTKLRAATYGRGLWETSLYDTSTGIATVTNSLDNISVFPSPSMGLITVDANLHQAVYLTLTVVNDVGQKFFETERQANAGDNQMYLDLSGLAKGEYLIRINSGNESVVKKITLVD